MFMSPHFTACWGQKLILAPSGRYLALIPGVWVWAISKRNLCHRLSVGEAFLTFQQWKFTLPWQCKEKKVGLSKSYSGSRQIHCPFVRRDLFSLAVCVTTLGCVVKTDGRF